MKTLQEAHEWYHAVCERLLDMKQLAKNHWDLLPWDGDLGKEERFKFLESSDILRSVEVALEPIEDLAILVFFSVFEAIVRDVLEKQVSSEVESLRNPLLKKAGEDLVDLIRKGNFEQVINQFKDVNSNLVTQVNQVRQYRNWVAHGRPPKPEPPADIEPKVAYQRLSDFLARIQAVSD